MEVLIDKFMTSSPLQMLLAIVFVFGLVFLARPDVFRLLLSKQSQSISKFSPSGSVTELLKEIDHLKITIQDLQDSLDRERNHLLNIENLLKKHETKINLKEQLEKLNIDHFFSELQYVLSMSGHIRMSDSDKFDEYALLTVKLISTETYASKKLTLNLFKVTLMNSWATTNLMNFIFKILNSEFGVGLKIILPNNNLGISLKQNIDKILSTKTTMVDIQVVIGTEVV